MSSTSGIKIVFGTGAWGRPGLGIFNDTSICQELLDKIHALGVRNIDTAQFYGMGTSETLLGECNAGDKFTIDTKAYGGAVPGSATEEGIVKDGVASLERLNLKKVDVFYIHGPDPTVPLSSMLAGINNLYKFGAFARFGLSNYPPSEVRAVYDHCKANDYVLPTVYEGNYNAAQRKQETILFPLLRELGMAFYAYSPAAGGFLTKSREDVENGAGRFDMASHTGKMYHLLYNRPAMMEGLAEWARIAEDEGVERAELACRWVRFNSALSDARGDALIIGARTVEQAEQMLGWLEKGPLSDKTCRRIDAFWEGMKHESPVDMMEGLELARKVHTEKSTGGSA